jgi:hypothetical protein
MNNNLSKHKPMNIILFTILTIILSPILLIYSLYLFYQYLKQRSEWIDDWNNYKPL